MANVNARKQRSIPIIVVAKGQSTKIFQNESIERENAITSVFLLVLQRSSQLPARKSRSPLDSCLNSLIC